MKGEKTPCFAAAQYYYNSSQPNLAPALGWLAEFLKSHPASPGDQYEGYYWKARLLQKQAAAAAARQSLE